MPISTRRQQSKEEQYEILPSSALLSRMIKLANDYPTFVTLTTAQEWFGMPRAGTDSDCPFDSTYPGESNKGCNNYILILHDKQAYPDDPDVHPNGGYRNNTGWKYLPDVFLSGAVHGDERIGPTALLEMAELAILAAYCESMPRIGYPGDTTELAGCRRSLEDVGVSPHHRRWLARLVATRRTVIVPTANAVGYSRNERGEGGVDPNRDFPFDVRMEEECMRTVAGRTINELFRSHLFQIGLTFHGGMEVIGYEWGAPTYLKKTAPDALAQDMIAGAYSRYANGFANHVAYDYGTMNDKVYYVRGGMEDWAFAGSWDSERVVQCRPTTLGGYPAEKTMYNNSTLRAFNMLIETSDKKEPSRDSLGKRTHPLISTNGNENGHIARNIRLALLAMDVVEPYVSIRSVEGLEFEDDVVPAVNQRTYNGGSYFETAKMIWIPPVMTRRRSLKDVLSISTEVKGLTVTIEWTVGGAFDIDVTEVVYGPWDKLPNKLAEAADGSYPSRTTLDVVESTNFNVASPSSLESNTGPQGRTQWHKDGASPTTEDNALFPTFQASIDLSMYPPGTTVAVFAKAEVDKSWLTAAPNVGPGGMGPVSHLVNARANPSYMATNAGKIVRGRDNNWWYSSPIALVVGSLEEESQILNEATASQSPVSVIDGEVKAVHVNSRMGGVPSGFALPKQTNMGSESTNSRLAWLLASLSCCLVLMIGCIILRRRRALRAVRMGIRRILDEEDGFDVEIPDRVYSDEMEIDDGVEHHQRFTID